MWGTVASRCAREEANISRSVESLIEEAANKGRRAGSKGVTLQELVKDFGGQVLTGRVASSRGEGGLCQIIARICVEAASAHSGVLTHVEGELDSSEAATR